MHTSYAGLRTFVDVAAVDVSPCKSFNRCTASIVPLLMEFTVEALLPKGNKVSDESESELGSQDFVVVTSWCQYSVTLVVPNPGDSVSQHIPSVLLRDSVNPSAALVVLSTNRTVSVAAVSFLKELDSCNPNDVPSVFESGVEIRSPACNVISEESRSYNEWLLKAAYSDTSVSTSFETPCWVSLGNQLCEAASVAELAEVASGEPDAELYSSETKIAPAVH